MPKHCMPAIWFCHVGSNDLDVKSLVNSELFPHNPPLMFSNYDQVMVKCQNAHERQIWQTSLRLKPMVWLTISLQKQGPQMDELRVVSWPVPGRVQDFLDNFCSRYLIDLVPSSYKQHHMCILYLTGYFLFYYYVSFFCHTKWYNWMFPHHIRTHVRALSTTPFIHSPLSLTTPFIHSLNWQTLICCSCSGAGYVTSVWPPRHPDTKLS